MTVNVITILAIYERPANVSVGTNQHHQRLNANVPATHSVIEKVRISTICAVQL